MSVPVPLGFICMDLCNNIPQTTGWPEEQALTHLTVLELQVSGLLSSRTFLPVHRPLAACTLAALSCVASLVSHTRLPEPGILSQMLRIIRAHSTVCSAQLTAHQSEARAWKTPPTPASLFTVSS